jgi:hypothetical protein
LTSSGKIQGQFADCRKCCLCACLYGGVPPQVRRAPSWIFRPVHRPIRARLAPLYSRPLSPLGSSRERSRNRLDQTNWLRPGTEATTSSTTSAPAFSLA